jgi:uncharacterized protein YsxB (DUF464 family)
MLKAEFFVLYSGEIIGFDISGHSGYAEAGQDIVCAAVSSAAYMTVNTITDVMGITVDIEVNEDTGHMRAIINKKDASVCSDILKGFKMHLLLLEEIYSPNIKVSYVEV